MKTLEELAIDRAAIEPKVILDQVEVAGRARRRGRNLVRVNRDLIAKKARTLYVPKRGQLTAATVSEGNTPSDSTITYSTVSIAAAKIGILVRISQEQIDGSEFDVINDMISEAGEALADKEDADIISKFTASGAVTTTTPASVNGSLLYEDILAAKVGVVSNYYVPTILLVNPNQESDLLKDTRFTDVSKYGDRAPIMNGEIGKIAGLSVLVSENMTAGKALVVDPNHAAWLAVKRDVELKSDDEPSKDSVALYFYEEYGCSIVNASAAAIITGC